MDALFAKGDEFYDAGYALQAEFFYGQAVVGIRSFQYALDRIAFMAVQKKEEAQSKAESEAAKAAIENGPEKVDDDWSDILGFDVNSMLSGVNSLAKSVGGVAESLQKSTEALADKLENFVGVDYDLEAERMDNRWTAISSLSIVSPYPYFFEGIVREMSGDKENAKKAYACAVCNPYMMRGRVDFTFLNDLTLDGIQSLWWKLERRVTKYLNRVPIPSSPFPRNWRNWNSAYLVCKGAEFMKNEESEVSDALPYFDAAVRANPFDKDLFVAAAAAHLMMGDVKGGAYYINQGLIVDPGNSDLLEMAADFRK